MCWSVKIRNKKYNYETKETNKTVQVDVAASVGFFAPVSGKRLRLHG